MRNISIIRFISIFFVILLLIINISFAIEYHRQIKSLEYYTFQRFMLGMRIMALQNKKTRDSELAKLGLKVSKLEKDEIRKNSVFLLKDSYCNMVKYKNELYFVPRSLTIDRDYLFRTLVLAGVKPTNKELKAPSKNSYLPLKNTQKFDLSRFWIFCGTINLVTIIFYIIVLKKLLRLKKLKELIHNVNDSNEEIVVDSNDELGQIAQEFNLSMKKINTLKDARALFLRNVLHELRTPVMKGKIISDLIEDKEYKDDLKQIFTRLKVLLGEMVKVEKFSSNEWKTLKKEYRIVDVLDHAIDLLFDYDISRIEIIGKENSPIVSADFELLAIAIKNLLDNALKYSKSSVMIYIEKDKLTIANHGEKPPEKRLKNMGKAFNRDVESTSKGFGLGLYISYSILENHNFKLEYSYLDSINYFAINFKKDKSNSKI